MRNRRWPGKWGWGCLCLFGSVAVVMALLPLQALARAGGGGGYHSSGGGGGHSSGGGHGGGGGGGFELLVDLIFLCIRFPIIGVPVVVLIVGFFIYASFQGKQTYQNNVIRKGGGAITETRKNAIAAKLMERDPFFSESAFCQRAAIAFHKIQAAWCAQDLNPVRPFISDGVHERFSLQFGEQRQAGYRENLLSLEVQQIAVVDLSSEGLFDEIAIRIRAKAADFRVSLKDGKYVSGSKAVEPFTEYWSFLRRRGTQTSPSKTGLIEGNCPNCGAAIELNQSSVCEHCKALLRSGEYDWVLAEITQESEWNGLSRGDMPGTTTLRERDPDFDVLALEDRASVMFWRKAATDRTGKIAPLRKMATPEFCAAYLNSLQTAPGVKRSYYGDCAVGAVIFRGVLLDDGQQGVDQALVEIRWAGTRRLVANDQPAKNTGEYALFRTLFVLNRNSNVQTNLGMAIASAHCPSCGAPEIATDADACEFCGEVLNDGAHGWVLSASIPMNAAEGQALLEQLEGGTEPSMNAAAPPPMVLDPTSLLAWLVQVAAADGNIDPREMEVLNRFASRRGIPRERLGQMIEAARNGALQSPLPSGPPEARAWITEMIDVGLADGSVGNEEYAVLRTFGNQIGLSQQDINLLIQQGRKRQYTTARDALRAQKRPTP